MNVREELKGNTVEQNQGIARSTAKPFAVATYNLKGDLNLGTIMRTAHLTGAREFFIFGHRSWDRRSAVGVHNYIPYERYENFKTWLDIQDFLIFEKGYSPVVVEQGGLPLSEWNASWKQPSNFVRDLSPCFIFGPEDTGFPESFPCHLSLEQLGVSRSYNVSSAAAIVLYNWSFSNA